jgi:hypothetical protein
MGEKVIVIQPEDKIFLNIVVNFDSETEKLFPEDGSVEDLKIIFPQLEEMIVEGVVEARRRMAAEGTEGCVLSAALGEEYYNG